MYTIYVIRQREKVLYVGKTINFQRRKWEHTYRRKLDKTYSFEVIEDNLSEMEAKKQEEFYISKYGTFLNGWNRTTGEGSKGIKTTQGDGRFTKGNNMVKKRKIKRVLCVETGKEYDSVKECATDICGTSAGVYQVCQGKNKTYKKMHFKYI